MIKRPLYLSQLVEFIDKPLIKVITGIRRCGKSAILSLLRNELKNRGVKDKYIVYINFESFEHYGINSAEKLYHYVQSKIEKEKRVYILLDEIQEVEEWEKAVNSFMADFDSDVYITGSNSNLLSSELATYLTGRYVQIHVYTLSFSEYLWFKRSYGRKELMDNKKEFESYIQTGGFPVLFSGDYSQESANKIVLDIYSSVILRDTIQRNKIRDIELLERVVKYIFENIGNKFSAKNVADFFKSQQRKIDLNTVYNYLNALENAYIIYRIPRFDVKGKEILKTQEKFYLADISILCALMGFKERLMPGILENIVMLELKRRGYHVYVGKSDDKEIDFIAVQMDKKIYVQVAYKLIEESTVERECAPLLGLRDNYPKYLLTMETTRQDNFEGIKYMHISDFLLLKEF